MHTTTPLCSSRSRRPRLALGAAALAAALAATALIAGGGGVTADADAARTATCATKGTTTIYATPKVRIYSDSAKGPVKQRDLFGCLRPAGRARFLFDGATNETSSDVRIVGERYVTLADFRVVPIDGAHETSLLAVDLKSGRKSSVRMQDPPREADFTLLADGSMVYVARDFDETTGELSTTLGTLMRVPLGGTARELDKGRIEDLAASGRAVYWTKDGAPVSRRF
jgi:hypothetical protein